ncbi:MAG: proline--tRNA ligase [Mariprofundaceae bacterium]
MKYSQFFAPTLRQDPADAEVVSHKLLLRAGYIRRVTSGIYDFLPMGLRVMRKIEQVVREEMNAAGAMEVLMPMVQPVELWHDSGRWDKYGPELLRFTDRHNHESCLGPTHEEVICDLVRRELRSYKQLPMNLYQIQAKFRDEIRPRFGLMRGREFIMKDAYSFHADDDDLLREYDNMYAAYERIFTRLGLEFRAVEADTGSIGGKRSHEFHVLADSGEDVIAHCGACDYAANVEKAASVRPRPDGEASDMAEVPTPGLTSVGEVAAHLGFNPALFIKTMMYRVSGSAHDGNAIAVCVRGDDQVQEVKLLRALGADAIEIAGEAELKALAAHAGFLGPQGIAAPVFADQTLEGATGMVAGANKPDAHTIGVDMARDVPSAQYVDVRSVREGDACAGCGGGLQLSRGIEVGHVFELGRCYTEAMNVSFQDKDGKKGVATMGCYGIGVSRLVAAVVEQCHDDAGICWPRHLAPFQLVLISIGNSQAVADAAASLYGELAGLGIEVLWDERKERPGVKFRDAELIGIPLRLVVGERGLADGVVEWQARGGESSSLPLSDAVAEVRHFVAEG